MERFKLKAPFKPAGDQPQAIESLVKGLEKGYKFQTLLGVTGSGKTFTIANVIERVQRPAIVIAPNKTLAAQLYGEYKQFFPENHIEYFISYYDYYQPEAYIPETDTYIEKDASINEEIEKLRIRATASILEYRDTLIVASVSCIYNLGSPLEFRKFTIPVAEGLMMDRDRFLSKLINIQYQRNDFEPKQGTFRVKGDTVDVFPLDRDEGVRFVWNENRIERIYLIDRISSKIIGKIKTITIFPVKHFLVDLPTLEQAIESIYEEMVERVDELEKQGKILEAKRLKTRTLYDIELLKEMGYCPGIENYSRHLSGRKPGERPPCLLDYFPEDYIVIIDESHVTVPQLNGMFRGDRSRKEKLVEYGFRLPSCLDNRPLKFEEFLSLINQVIFVSATPGPYELKHSEQIVEQVVRPTGLVDPPVIIRPAKNQIEDLIGRINERVKREERVLVTTLTKRMAEDIADYLSELGIKVKYIHSEFDAIERVEILRDLRLGEVDVLVGINLLREGLDLPEVSLVAILDADKEGFLRDERAIIQIAGRAARNVNSEVILYADRITRSLKAAVDEMERRRKKQIEYNRLHNITPKSIKKSVEQVIKTTTVADEKAIYEVDEVNIEEEQDPYEQLKRLNFEMKKAAEALNFERAAKIRDLIRDIKRRLDEESLAIPRKKKRRK